MKNWLSAPDRALAIVVILVGAFLYWETYSFPSTDWEQLGVAFWPRLVLIGLGLLSLFLIWKGTLEPGELPVDCAARELEEETGYVAGELIEILQLFILPAYSDEKIYLYLARYLSRSKQNLDKDEIIDVVKYPLEDTMKMIDEGKIVDALTILSLQRVWVYLQNKKW